MQSSTVRSPAAAQRLQNVHKYRQHVELREIVLRLLKKTPYIVLQCVKGQFKSILIICLLAFGVNQVKLRLRSRLILNLQQRL